MAGGAGKPYGLIMMKKPTAPVNASAAGSAAKRSIFDDSDDETEAKQKKSGVGETRIKKQVQKQWEEALEQDPSAFAYDEVYDEMSKHRQEKSETKKADKDHKPKYIEQLLRTAEKRQRDYEAREERKQQKELEQDAELHADKEVFVTATYRKKMEELEKYKEEEQRRERLEAMMDVTKQKDLSGFYRHFLNDYEKATSSSSADIQEPNAPEKQEEHEPSKSPSPTSCKEKEPQWRRGRTDQDSNRQKTYRQRRRSSSSENESPSRKQSREDQAAHRRTRSQSSSDEEFSVAEARKKPSTADDSTASKGMTRVEKARRRYFTPSPPPQPQKDDQDRHKKQADDQDKAARRRREKSSEKSPKRSTEKEVSIVNAVVVEQKALSEEEIREQRLEKLRQLLKRRNDAASIEEYRKRYFERKNAVAV